MVPCVLLAFVSIVIAGVAVNDDESGRTASDPCVGAVPEDMNSTPHRTSRVAQGRDMSFRLHCCSVLLSF